MDNYDEYKDLIENADVSKFEDDDDMEDSEFLRKSGDNKKKPEKKKKNFFIKLRDMFIPLPSDSTKEKISKIFSLICIVVFVVCVVFLSKHFYNEHRQKDLNSNLQQLHSQVVTESLSSSSSLKPDSSSNTTMLPSFNELYKLNHEVVGWIEIPDSKVNFPVLQTKDNDFYLSHDYMKKYSETGAIFADYRYKLTSGKMPDNTIIYGHNTLNGTFFGALHQYKKLDYIKLHPVINFSTLYNESKYKIFACFFANVDGAQDKGVVFDYHNRILFNDETAFKSFYDEVMKRSYYNTDVDVKYGDELITLSTCSLEIKNARFVIVARKLRDGESPEVNTDKTVINSDKYMPLDWYKVNKIKAPR